MGSAFASEHIATVAPGFSASVPEDWKLDTQPTTRNDKWIQKVQTAFSLPGGGYIQIRHAVFKDASEDNDIEHAYEDINELKQVCCESNTCLKPKKLNLKKERKYVCSYEEPVKPQIGEAYAIGHRKSEKLSVYIVLRKKNIPQNDVAFFTITYSEPSKSISSERLASIKQFADSIRTVE